MASDKPYDAGVKNLIRQLTRARYSRKFATQLLKGALRNVFDVQDSDTFQEIKEIGLAEGFLKGINEGKAEGIATGKVEGKAEGERQSKRDTISRIGTKRFGALSPQIVERITGTNDLAELDAMIDRLLEAESWDEFWKP